MSSTGTNQGDHAMEFFVGLDVSLEDTHFCVVDEGGRIVRVQTH